ncbi:hypothetical protein MTO96_025259 [Rhipicephalus appendiculatus]
MQSAPDKQHWRIVWWMVVGSYITLSLALKTRMEPSGIRHPRALLPPTSTDAHVAVISCKGYWDAVDAEWICLLPQGSTVWLARNPDLFTLLHNNQAKGRETILLVPSLGQGGYTECARFMATGYLPTYRTTWILLGKDGDTEALVKYYLSLPGTLLCETGTLCAVPPNDTAGCATSPNEFWVLSMNCDGPHGKNPRKRSHVIKDAAINVACMTLISNTPQQSCDVDPYRRFISLLRRLNVTVRGKVFSDEKTYGYAMVRTELDVAFSPVPVHERLMEWFDFPAVVLHVHTVFYSKKETEEIISIYGILKKSRFAFASLVGALATSLLTLVIMDALEFKYSFLDHAYDTAMLLLAPVLATSATTPVWRLWRCSRRLVVYFWFLCIFPLSTYMRSRLISTMSVRVEPNSMDTAEELEAALDRRSLFPCLVAGSSDHYEYNVNASSNSLARKISLAFHANRESKKLVTPLHYDCLKCALRLHHVCILNSLSASEVRNVSRELLESKDKLRTVFTTTLTRKTFPLKAYYRSFLLRVHETGLLHGTNVHKKDIPLQDVKGDDNHQLLEFTGFFKFFLISLTVAAGALIAERILKIQRSRRECSSRLITRTHADRTHYYNRTSWART